MMKATSSTLDGKQVATHCRPTYFTYSWCWFILEGVV